MNVHVYIYIYYNIYIYIYVYICIYKYVYIMGVISLQPCLLRFEISPGASRCGSWTRSAKKWFAFLANEKCDLKGNTPNILWYIYI